MSEINWPEVENVYLTTDMNFVEISKEFNINYNYLKRRAFDEKWAHKRENFRKSVRKSLFVDVKEEIRKKRLKFDELTNRACEVAVAEAARELTAHFKNEKKLTSKKIKEYIDICAKSQDVMYRAWDIPLPKQTISHEDGDPFEKYQDTLAKEKAMLDNISNVDDGLIEVEIEPPQLN